MKKIPLSVIRMHAARDVLSAEVVELTVPVWTEAVKKAVPELLDKDLVNFCASTRYIVGLDLMCPRLHIVDKLYTGKYVLSKHFSKAKAAELQSLLGTVYGPNGASGGELKLNTPTVKKLIERPTCVYGDFTWLKAINAIPAAKHKEVMAWLKSLKALKEEPKKPCRAGGKRETR